MTAWPTRVRPAAVLLTLFLTACPSLPGPVAQLDRFKTAEAGNHLTAIETEAVDSGCARDPAFSDACPQLFAIQARACLQLARSEAAPNAACPPATDSARRRLDCAAAGYGRALAGTGFPASQVEEFTESRARALYCGASLRSPPDGLSMAREASAELDRLPANPRRDQLAAAAALYVANREQVPAAQRCEAAHRAMDLAKRGLAGNPGADLAGGLRAAEAGARAAANRIDQCGGN